MDMRIQPEVDKIGTYLQQTSLKYFPVIFAIRLLIMVQIHRNTLNNTTALGRNRDLLELEGGHKRVNVYIIS